MRLARPFCLSATHRPGGVEACWSRDRLTGAASLPVRASGPQAWMWSAQPRIPYGVVAGGPRHIAAARQPACGPVGVAVRVPYCPRDGCRPVHLAGCAPIVHFPPIRPVVGVLASSSPGSSARTGRAPACPRVGLLACRPLHVAVCLSPGLATLWPACHAPPVPACPVPALLRATPARVPALLRATPSVSRLGRVVACPSSVPCGPFGSSVSRLGRVPACPSLPCPGPDPPKPRPAHSPTAPNPGPSSSPPPSAPACIRPCPRRPDGRAPALPTEGSPL